MKLVITAGGGGHFAAAYAVIQKLPKDTEILIIGRKYTFEGDNALSLEYQTAEKEHWKFESLSTGRLQRKITFHTIPSLLKIPYGYVQSLILLQKFKPDCVLSFGGYVSLPVTFAAKSLGIPVVIHEQTLEAGAANKLAAKFAKTICISWQESAPFFPKEKTVLTGNPIKEFKVQNSKFKIEPEDLPLVFVTGGSGGAHFINTVIEKGLETFLTSFRIVHQTGDAGQYHDFDRLRDLVSQLPPKLQSRYHSTKFIDPDEIGTVFQEADIVLGRAGMNTVTEVLYFGKPVLFIPLPYGQHNEQLKNATMLQKIGLAEILIQQDATPDLVYQTLTKMYRERKTYHEAAERGKKLLNTDAAKLIIHQVQKVVG